jgi:hypothetical protein
VFFLLWWFDQGSNMAMKLKGKGISLIIAIGLSSAPVLLFSVGIRDFHKLSLSWYALLAPWQPGVAVLHDVIINRVGGSYSRMYVSGFASALLCWFALAEGVRAVAKQKTAKAWLRGLSWLILFLVLYGFGAWVLYSFWHAP